VICPWCYIGKRRLEQAIARFGSADEIGVRWLPFQLNPNMPPEGMDRRAYRSAKFGSWERSLALDAAVTAIGERDGIAFDFAQAQRTPNTLDAHRLIWLAGERGVQDAFVEALFRGYFAEGKDVSDRAVLRGIASQAGLDRSDVDRLIHGDAGLAGVRAEEERGRRLVVSSVPTFFVNGRIAFSGARPPEEFLVAFRSASAGPSSEGLGTTCAIDAASGKPAC
jgi:predicted DsbA family dithiol-disulfide isomerase